MVKSQKYTKWTGKEILFLKENYPTKGPKSCSETLNRTYNSIKMRASLLKLTSPIKYPVNQNYFDILNDENTNILGFLCADGSSQQLGPNWWILSIPLARKDKIILEHIRDKISPTRPIYNYQQWNKKYKKYYPNSILQISGLNQNFVQRIQELGIFPQKTGKEFIPIEYLNEDLKWSWLLGLFDGDGCISKNRKNSYTFSIASGSEQFLKQLQYIFFKKYYCWIGKEKESNGWKLQISKRESIKEIAQKMYQNSPFYLERKKQRFLQYGLLSD